jgi:hypothetical protein
MSTTAISQSLPPQQLQTFFHHRTADMLQLRQALQSGDLAGAQQAFQALVDLGQKGPLHSPDPFLRADRQQAFAAIGNALQAGNLQGAEQALHALVNTFHHPGPTPLPAVPGPGHEPMPPVKGPGPVQITGVNVIA